MSLAYFYTLIIYDYKNTVFFVFFQISYSIFLFTVKLSQFFTIPLSTSYKFGTKFFQIGTGIFFSPATFAANKFQWRGF